MLVNAKNVQFLFTNLRAAFESELQRAGSDWERIAMRIPSTTKTERYDWITNFPAMRKWVGEKTVKSLAAFTYSITNDDWEMTISVDRNDIDDDQTGKYAIQARSAGKSAADLPADIMMDLVNNGFTSRCHDGQYFFDNEHPQGTPDSKLRASNKGTKKLSVASQKAAQESFGAARIQMQRYTDEEGRPLKINPRLLLVPPELEDIANVLMTTDRLEDGRPNLYKGAAGVMVDQRLISPTAWFLVDVGQVVRPFIYQERKKPVLVQQTSLENDDVFMRRQLKFGAEARAAGGYGLWQLAYGSTGTDEVSN